MGKSRYAGLSIADLQAINTNLEAERRRQHRAELADELRKRLTSRRKTRATLMSLDEVEQWIDELSPVVHCDNPPEVKPNALDELRSWLQREFASWAIGGDYVDGRQDSIEAVLRKLNQLSPPVICDNPPNHPVTDEVAFYEATSK